MPANRVPPTKLRMINQFTQPPSTSFRPWLSWVPVLISSLFLVLTLGAAVYYSVQTQDLTKFADQAERKVELIFVPSSTPLRVTTLSTLYLRLNTQGEQIDGVQIVFDFKTSAIDGLTLKVKEPSGLRRAWEKVEGIPGGKRVSLALVTTDPNQPFSNGSPVDIAELVFTVNQTGPIDIVFDDGWTKANKHKQIQNVLKSYVALQYQVDVAPSPKPKPTPTPGAKSTTTKTTTSKGGTTNVGGAPVATVSITTKSSSAAADLSVCNRTCIYSSECGTGFLCYQKQCRRIGNVTSSTCQSDGETGVGVCNDACTNSGNCGAELTCYQNRCRNATNPESGTCQKSALSDAQAIARLCDNDCTTNAECGDHLSCYRGQCRLATNPSSQTCSVSTPETEKTDQTAKSSPSPSLAPSSDQGQTSWIGQIFRWLLILGAIVGLGIAGVMGYLWYQDRQAGGL